VKGVNILVATPGRLLDHLQVRSFSIICLVPWSGEPMKLWHIAVQRSKLGWMANTMVAVAD
jgi:hypothetical protein